MDKKLSTRMNVATMLAAMAASAGAFGIRTGSVTPKMHTYVPMMVTSPPEVIAAWNAAVEAKKPPKPSKHHRNFRGDSGQHPKFAKVRTHRPASCPQRDEHGAYTLIGRNPFMPRRKWLAGISSQRGY